MLEFLLDLAFLADFTGKRCLGTTHNRLTATIITTAYHIQLSTTSATITAPTQNFQSQDSRSLQSHGYSCGVASSWIDRAQAAGIVVVVVVVIVDVNPVQ